MINCVINCYWWWFFMKCSRNAVIGHVKLDHLVIVYLCMPSWRSWDQNNVLTEVFLIFLQVQIVCKIFLFFKICLGLFITLRCSKVIVHWCTSRQATKSLPKKKKVYRQRRLENGLFQNVSKIFTGSDIIAINSLTHNVMDATLFLK